MDLERSTAERHREQGAVDYALARAARHDQGSPETLAAARGTPHGWMVDEVARDRDAQLLQVATAVANVERLALLGPVRAGVPRPDAIVVKVAVAVDALRLDDRCESLNGLRRKAE